MKEQKEYAAIIIQLLKGSIYFNDPCWRELLIHQKAVKEYFSQIGISLILHESDGYAYLTQPEHNEESGEKPLPRLMRKMPLTFEASLLCVLLREEMDSFDAGSSESTNLYISLSEIRDRLQVYFREKYDQIKLYRELDRYVRQIEKTGLIRQSNSKRENQEPVFEVLRLIKAKVGPEFIVEFKRKLTDYAESI